MMSNESEEKVSVSLWSQMKFFRKYYGIIWFICSQLGMAFFIIARIANDYIMGHWAYH